MYKKYLETRSTRVIRNIAYLASTGQLIHLVHESQ